MMHIAFLLVLIALIIFGIFYFLFINIDFVGKKDPRTVEENVIRENSKLLSAEFREDGDYCEITLLDKNKIQINAGEKNGKTDLILFEEYHLSGDTIIIDYENNHDTEIAKYMNTNKLLIDKNEIYFQLDSNNVYNKSKTMKVRFNTIHN